MFINEVFSLQIYIVSSHMCAVQIGHLWARMEGFHYLITSSATLRNGVIKQERMVEKFDSIKRTRNKSSVKCIRVTITLIFFSS